MKRPYHEEACFVGQGNKRAKGGRRGEEEMRGRGKGRRGRNGVDTFLGGLERSREGILSKLGEEEREERRRRGIKLGGVV